MLRQDDSETVWSSTDGDLRRSRERPPEAPTVTDGPVRVKRETAGRRGKTVTTVTNVPVDAEGLRALAKRLKKRCGVGGSAKDGTIEIQGDHRDTVIAVLEDAGHQVIRAGG